MLLRSPNALLMKSVGGIFCPLIALMMFSSLLFLFSLNPVLWRLAAMLPDETLRLETKLFTTINRYLIALTVSLLVAYFILGRFTRLPDLASNFVNSMDRTSLWLVLFLVLVPVAITMALIWKIKEVILHSVFSSRE